MKANFRTWLVNEKLYSSPKQISDCISRVKLVEKAFLVCGIDIDEEFDRNGCILPLRCITADGHNPERQLYPELELPFDTNGRQMNIIANAFKKYVLFRSISEGKHINELSGNTMTKRIFSNYYAKKQEEHPIGS